MLLTTVASLLGCRTYSLCFPVQFVIERERRGDYLGKTVQVDVTAKGNVRTVATINGAPSNDSDEERPN